VLRGGQDRIERMLKCGRAGGARTTATANKGGYHTKKKSEGKRWMGGGDDKIQTDVGWGERPCGRP